MAHLRFVTLTGADERTSFARMAQLSQSNQFVEWGVLFNQATAGCKQGFPALAWLEQFAARANAERMHIALHLCGTAVRALIREAGTGAFSPTSMRLLELAAQFGRVQLNTHAKAGGQGGILKLVNLLYQAERHTCVILQWNERNRQVCEQLGGTGGFECLVDDSSGRGVERHTWPVLSREVVPQRGFAGGLSIENVRTQLSLIDEAASGMPFWIDAQGRLRNVQNQFDLDLCGQFLREVRAWQVAAPACSP